MDDDDVDWDGVESDISRKKAVSIRLDEDVLAFFKSQGKGYQTRINTVLRHYVEAKSKAKNEG